MEDHNGAYESGLADDSRAALRGPGDGLPDGPDAGPDHPMPVPRPATGEFRVDAALSLLDDLTELPVTEHPAVFERVHARLGEVLGELAAGDLAAPPGRAGD